MSVMNVQEHVYRTIRKQVVAGRWAAGARLSELALAQELGVNRNPVREALLHLSGEGLLERAPGAGCRIAAITPESLLHIYHLREALEGMAARLAAKAIGEIDLFNMEKEHELMQRLVAPEQEEDHAEADTRFHRLLVSSSGNPELLAVWDRHQIRALSAKNLLLPSVVHYSAAARHPMEFKAHSAILDALRRRNPDDAEQVARSHIRRAIKGFMDAIVSKEQEQ